MTQIDDRISTKITRLSKECANIYEMCRTKPSDALWAKVDSLEATLQNRLASRPISPTEIDAAVIDHRKQFQALCMRMR